jgi:DNA polymerase III sliding clamp (beta) subunit (PCNA family)
MKATIESDLIQEALRVVLRLAPPITGNVTLESDGAKLVLKSASDLARCSVVIPGDVKGEAFFAIPPESLRDATKGRKELLLDFSKSMLNVKSGKYSTNLATVDAIKADEDGESKAKAQTWKLSAEQASWLKSAVSTISLRPGASEKVLPISVKLTSKAAFVACYDTNHMSFINSKEVQGDLDVTLPLDTFSAVLDVFNKVQCTMQVSETTLKVKNKLVEVSLALPSRENEEVIEMDAVIQQAKEALATKGKDIEVAKSDVTAFLDNARSVASKERSELTATTEPGKLNLTVTTTNGSSKVSIKANTKASTKFKIDFEFFDEAVRKGADNLVFKLVTDSFLMVSGKESHSVIALNQD